jgi:adenylate cyclase
MTVSNATVREQLARILTSRHFAQTTRLGRLLRFIVEQTLAGRTTELKEYSIAIAVFDKPESFDPRLDAIVRVQARAMRAKLDRYYGTDGLADAVVIRCSAGSYVPAFQVRRSVPETHAQSGFWNARIDALHAFLVRKAVQ